VSPWKKWAAIVGGAALALTLAFSAGRFSKPAQVIEAHVFHAFAVEKVVEHETVKVVVEKAKAEIVYVDRVITKEGEVHEKIVTKTVETSKAEGDKVVDKTSDKTTDTTAKAETITKNDFPRFTVSLLGGAQLDSRINLIPNAGPFTLGLAFQYRIAGPLQIGAFGLTTGAFGLMIGATF
jgi:uncharacterized membrane protein